MDQLFREIKKAKSEAMKLLGNTSFLRKKVEVEKIAEQLGIAVRRMPLQKDVSGIIKINSNLGTPVIVVNQEHHEKRQRFTIAHEIGHFLMHSEENVHVDGVIFFRGPESTTGSNTKEIQANQFAAELLMPSIDLVRRYNGLIQELNDDENFSLLINKLATFYDVSEQALSIKLGSTLH